MKSYHSIQELMDLADAEKVSPGIIACRLEAETSGRAYQDVWKQMDETIPVFMRSIRRGLGDHSKSRSGLAATRESCMTKNRCCWDLLPRERPPTQWQQQKRMPK